MINENEISKLLKASLPKDMYEVDACDGGAWIVDLGKSSGGGIIPKNSEFVETIGRARQRIKNHKARMRVRKKRLIDNGGLVCTKYYATPEQHAKIRKILGITD